ncbi:MAG: efflux RND transporter periplasmic adaptor subunit [Thiohalospira sp.]
MNKIIFLLLAILCIAFAGCKHNDHNHGHSAENDKQIHANAHVHDHDDGHEHETGHIHNKEKAHEHSSERESDKVHQHEYQTQRIELQPFHEIIKTSGEITVPPYSKIDIVASGAGKIFFAKKQAAEGFNFSANESLFLISGRELIDNSIDLKYQQSLLNYEKVKSDFERAQLLKEDQIISEKEYQQIKAEYEKSKAEYKIISGQFRKGGTTITAPAKGFIHELFVSEGQYVEQGQKLATIIKKDKLRLRAEVSQKYASSIQHIESANFTTNGSKEIFDTKQLNGKLLSFGQSLNTSGLYIPVIFDMDYHPHLLPGSYAQIFLKSKTIENSVVIPKTALLEEQGHYYVFVEKHHDEFEKRQVIIGANDGNSVLIQSGLKGGEIIVVEGVYQVKLANMSNELPAHSHSH